MKKKKIPIPVKQAVQIYFLVLKKQVHFNILILNTSSWVRFELFTIWTFLIEKDHGKDGGEHTDQKPSDVDPYSDPHGSALDLVCWNLVLWIRIRILLSSCKNSKKNLDSYHFVTLFDFLSLKNDVNVPSKSNTQKKLCKKLVFCWHLEGLWRKLQDPDPLVRGMDPRIRIRITPKCHGSATLLEPVPDPGGQKGPSNNEIRWQNFWGAVCSLLQAGCFSRSLNVLHGGLAIEKLQLLILK